MTKITLDDGSIQAPQAMDADEQDILCEWLPPKDGGKITGMMEFAGYWRNVNRASQLFGPHLIKIMVEAGALEPEQDPCEALLALIRKANGH